MDMIYDPWLLNKTDGRASMSIDSICARQGTHQLSDALPSRARCDESSLRAIHGFIELLYEPILLRRAIEARPPREDIEEASLGSLVYSSTRTPLYGAGGQLGAAAERRAQAILLELRHSP